MKKIIINPRQLNEIITMDYNMPELKKVQRKIYKSVSDFCGKMHSDSAWQDVKELIGMINSVEGVEDVHVGAGEYTNFTNPENGAYRDYDTIVLTPFGKLYGYIRCHAAGTMDDIFKYYDMTISLYPDKKRDMEERLEEINEAMAMGTADNLGGVEAAYNDVKAGLPNAEETPIKIDVTDNTDGPAYTMTDAELNQKGTSNLPSNTGSIAITTENANRYTKRQVELGRMLEMRKHGKVYSKKQLDEMFNADSNLLNIIKQASFFKLYDAVLIAFGQEISDELGERVQSGEDMTEVIMNLLDNATPEQKEEFLSELR